jgi:hypothetical protein
LPTRRKTVQRGCYPWTVNGTVAECGGPLWITDAAAGIKGGMSGSPIITEDGAIGVVSISGGGADYDRYTEGGPNPHLAYHLPSRFKHGDRFGQPPAALARQLEAHQ